MKKTILKSMIVLAIPTMLEQILSTLLQYVDTAMVGHLGEQATAAVSVTTTVTWLIGSISSAVGVAVLALISRAVGQKDEKMIRRISQQALVLVLVCGIGIGVPALALSPFIPRWMGAEKTIWRPASIYFSIICLPMVFRTAGTVCGAALRATKDTKTPMLISVGANGLNIVMNYLLIYTAGLGVTGAAVSSALSYTLQGACMFYAYRKNTQLHWKWTEFAVDKAILKECGKVGIPVLGTSAASCLGYVVFAGLVSGMGTTIFAAHSIAVTAETVFYIAGYGLRTATSTLVGISLGEKDQKKFETVSTLSIVLTMGMMFLNGVILYVVAYPLMGLLTNSRTVVQLGARMLRLVAFSEPFYGLMVVMEGIFYGLGRTRYAFVVETFCMWGIRICFTAVCVKIFNMDLKAVWYCMIADNVCKAVLLAVPMLSKKYRERLFYTLPVKNKKEGKNEREA